MAGTSPCHMEGVSVILMKPGPATSAFTTPPSFLMSSKRLAASSFGFALTCAASTIAALVAISPWLASLVGVASTLATSACGNRAAAIALTSLSIFLYIFMKSGSRYLEDALVFFQREAVGHAGQIVAHHLGTLTA